MFDRRLASRSSSSVLAAVYQRAFGDEYPSDASPNSFISLTTLRGLASACRIGEGDTLVDFGCGHGGPGLWVAQQTGAQLVGFDLSEAGVRLARERAESLGLGERARFEVRDLTRTGLPDGRCDAIMSIDVLIFVPDKRAAMAEAARILKLEHNFVFTTWEQREPTERLGVTQLADYRPTLADTGFLIDEYDEVPGWREQHRALLEGILAAESDLTAEIGAAAASGWTAMASGALREIPIRRYVFVSARRTS
jgi:SAM-dependent methyltransferase